MYSNLDLSCHLDASHYSAVYTVSELDRPVSLRTPYRGILTPVDPRGYNMDPSSLVHREHPKP